MASGPEGLLAVATAGGPEEAAARALQLMPGASLVVRGRLLPEGRALDLPDLSAGGGPAALEVEGVGAADAFVLAPGVIRVSRVGALPDPTADERLAGAIVALHASRSGAAGVEEERLVEFGRRCLRLNHDVRNPLCAIALNAQLLELSLDPEGAPEVAEKVASISRATSRIRDLMQELAGAKAELRAPAGSGAK